MSLQLHVDLGFSFRFQVSAIPFEEVPMAGFEPTPRFHENGF
jgi:hypothetical protein